MTIYKALSMPEQVALQREVEELRARVAGWQPIEAAPSNAALTRGAQEGEEADHGSTSR